MKQGARIQSAIDILTRISSSRIPMDNTIRDFMQFKRYIGSKDRAAIVELVYNITRATARLNWWLDQVKVEDSPRIRVLVYLSLKEEYQLFQINQFFDGEKYSPEVLSAEEEKIVKAIEEKT
jgi:16S rRNA (cytosine967-C5)-methyltransferase